MLRAEDAKDSSLLYAESMMTVIGCQFYYSKTELQSRNGGHTGERILLWLK